MKGTLFEARRLDAAHRCLRAAEAGSTSVTDVAVRYGFNHLGKFAMEYEKAFGESPSVTLRLLAAVFTQPTFNILVKDAGNQRLVWNALSFR